LADGLDVSRQTINAIETVEFDPILPLAFRAARLLALRIETVTLCGSYFESAALRTGFF